MWEHVLDRNDSEQGQMAGCCERGNEPSGSVKCGEFLNQLKTDHILKKDAAPWRK